MEDCCVCCGTIIPEGTLYCLNCAANSSISKNNSHENKPTIRRQSNSNEELKDISNHSISKRKGLKKFFR